MKYWQTIVSIQYNNSKMWFFGAALLTKGGVESVLNFSTFARIGQILVPTKMLEIQKEKKNVQTAMMCEK